MASLKQIQANRLNALHATGPRTETGKAVSRLNALKSGVDAQLSIIPGEDAAALKQLTAEYTASFQPATPAARFLVDTLIAGDWQLRRLRRVEAALWTGDIKNTFKHSDSPLACTAANQDSTFERLQRRIDATLRNYRRALAELRTLSQDHPQPSAPELTLVPATIPAAPEPPDPKPAPVPIGFVPPTLATPPTGVPEALLHLVAPLGQAADSTTSPM